MRTALTLITLLGTPAYADTFCSQLDALFQGATSITSPQGAEASCTTSLALSGETSKHCAWAFDYRSAQAMQTFKALTNAAQSCLDPSLTPKHDQNVNHPDFYDLRIIESPNGDVGISLKDKGALQKTYVFLHVTLTK